MPQDVLCGAKPAFLFFDETVSQTAESLAIMLNASMRYVSENIPVLLMCEAYCSARKRVLEAAHCALRGDGTQAFLIFNTLYEAHMREISQLMEAKESRNSAMRSWHECMNNTHENIRLLLSGITRLKELSEKTLTLLMSMSSALAAYTVALYLQMRESISVHVIETIDEMPSVFKSSYVYVVLAYDSVIQTHHLTDALAASYAQKAQARVMDIWTHTHGVMTANTEYVEKAQAVRTLTYEMALEVAMLGGRVFHPLALQMLIKESIPIAIYSTANVQEYTTLITASEESAQRLETVITNQNSCTICTVSSTDMFHRYGYVEKLFRICSEHGVSVETISTSEISVTISFFTKSCSDAFLSALRTLGQVRCYHDYSLISLISSSPWNSPQKIACILSSIPQAITIEALSLGNCELSFSFAVKSVHLKNVIQSIHDVLYPLW